jgi:site-specific recombinase
VDDQRIAIEVVLDGFLRRPKDPLDAFIALFAAIRPREVDDADAARTAFAALIALLETREDYRVALRDALIDLFETRREVSFFTDAGILPSSGFFSELWRRLVDHVLPEIPDRTSFKDCVGLVLHERDDDIWLGNVPIEERTRLWSVLALHEAADRDKLDRLSASLLESMQILATRIAALGVEPELVRLCPEVEAHGSPFLGLAAEVHDFVTAYRASLADNEAAARDEKQLLVLVSQCEALVAKAHRIASREGTTLDLTYLLKRLEQSLRRLEFLTRIVATRFTGDVGEELLEAWTRFFREAVSGVIRSKSVRAHVGGLIGLLALRVTENAGRTGEHYIATNRIEYTQIWRAAAGAGLIIAAMALVKIVAAKLNLAPLNQAFVYSLNYALGFVIIVLLHFIIATKQPAMTAATIAATVSRVSGKVAQLDRLASLVVATVRSQIAAILGNVMVAFPTALVLGFWLPHALGHPLVSVEKAEHLVHDLDPIHSLAIPHAAIAGIYLCLSGLVSGYFDNRAAYGRLGDRTAALPWLRRLVGARRADSLGAYVDRSLGGIVGNAFFGVCLGSTATVGLLLGLPLDIRHIAFAAANLAYALLALDLAVPLKTMVWSVLGVALIGITNLTVSFSLALWVALRSQGVSIAQAAGVGRLLWRRFVSQPGSFLFPPADAQPARSK